MTRKLVVGRRRMAPASALCAAAAVTAMAVAILPHRLELVRNNYDVGHADHGAYALQARSLARGDGLMIPYVSNFYIPYSVDICRMDDHWPPLVPVILAPAFRVWGVNAAVARMTMMTLGTVCLPLAAAWLAGAATRRTWAALVAALCMLLPAAVVRASGQILGDVAVAALGCVYVACLLMAQRRSAWYIGAGIAGALAWYGKGSQLILLPLLPVLAVVSVGWRALRRRALWSGVAAFLLLAAPSWIANARSYGNPFHSTQNYVSAFFGLSEGPWDDWDTNFYGVYWGRDLPRMTDRFRDREAFARSAWRNAEVYARAFCLGIDAGPRDWARLGRYGYAFARWIHPRAWLAPLPKALQAESAAAGLPPMTHPTAWPVWPVTMLQLTGVAWGLFATGVWTAVAAWRTARTVLRRTGGGAAAGRPPGGAATVLTVLTLAQIVFVVLLWRADERFVLPALPLVTTLGLMGLSAPLHGFGRLLARLPGARRRPVRRIVRHTRWVLAGLLCLAAAHLWSRHAEDLAAWQHGKARLQAAALPQYPHYAELGRRLQALPDSAILMTRNPWQMLFYAPAGLRAVGLPYATPDVLFGVARHYGVTHLVWDKNRPGLREFILSGHPALRRVIDKPYPVYAIDYTRFAPGELTDPAAAPPAPVWRADAPRPAGPRHPARAR